MTCHSNGEKKCWFMWLCSLLQSPLLLVIRLIWGVLFVIAGTNKLTNLSQTIELFNSLNIPYPILAVWAVALFETVGGILLILGWWTRLIAMPLVVILVTALLTAHREATLQLWQHFEVFMSQPPFTFLFATFTLIAFGPGCFSLDAWRCCKKNSCDTKK